MIHLTQIRSDLGEFAVKSREVEVYGDREVGALLQSFAAILLTVTEAVEEIQRGRSGDLMDGCESLDDVPPAERPRWEMEEVG